MISKYLIMSTINLKPDKVRTRFGVLTLDQCHTNRIETFQREKELLPAKKKKLEVYKQILVDIDHKNPKQITDNDIRTKSRCKTIIEELTYEIKRIEDGLEEMEYFSEAVDILVEYYTDTSTYDDGHYNGYDNGDYNGYEDYASNFLTYEESISETNETTNINENNKKVTSTNKLITSTVRKNINRFQDSDSLSSDSPTSISDKSTSKFEVSHSQPSHISHNDLSNLLNKNSVSINGLHNTISNTSSNNKNVDKLKLLNQQSINKQKITKVTKHRVTKTSNASNILSSLGIAKGATQNKAKNIMDNMNTNPKNTNPSTGSSQQYDESINQQTHKKNNAELFEYYRYITDPTYINENNKKNKNVVEICSLCNVEKRYNHVEGTLICKVCGRSSPLFIEAEKLNSKDKTNEKTTYPYKKINHLNEWLNQIQAKQTTDIPDFVFQDIKNELKKNREDDLTALTPKRICDILKKLHLTHYKEHHIYILCQISGQKPPTLLREEEETIREMFRDIQKPYEKYKPKKRINFSSYSFIIYKICELLELDHITKMLFLLKSKEKLRDLDTIWKNICRDLHWQYIPSTN